MPSRRQRQEVPAGDIMAGLPVELHAALRDFNPSTVPSDFQLLSTLRYDPPAEGVEISDVNFFLLHLHWQRMKFATVFFQWKVRLGFEDFKSKVYDTAGELPRTSSYKLRLLLSDNGRFEIQAFEIARDENLLGDIEKFDDPTARVYRVFADTEPMVIGAFTSFKTTNRDHYNAVRERLLRPEQQKEDGRPQEVLLYNPNHFVTEGTITNVALRRNDRWVTPRLTSGGLCGVMRRHLVDTSTIFEGDIRTDSLVNGEPVLIFNAIIGAKLGELVLPEEGLSLPHDQDTNARHNNPDDGDDGDGDDGDGDDGDGDDDDESDAETSAADAAAGVVPATHDVSIEETDSLIRTYYGEDEA